MFSVTFDVDGVIADTRELVRESYRDVGVEMPVDAWGKPWRDWLPRIVEQPARVHIEKNNAYLRRLERDGVPLLAGGTVARKLIVNEPDFVVRFLTGASFDAASAILRQAGFSPNYLLGTSCPLLIKCEVLRRHIKPGVYVDDVPYPLTSENIDFVERIEESGITCIKYVDDEDELTKEIKSWTP